MNDDFEATFVVDLAPSEVWETLTNRTIEPDKGEVHYVLPGFPSSIGAMSSSAALTTW